MRPPLPDSSTGPALTRVVGAYALFGLVEMAIWMVVVLWAYDRGGAGLTAVVAVVQLVPAALLSPAAAAYADRGNRARALVGTHAATAVASALTAVALLADTGTAVVVAASALATTATATVRPVHFAVLPQLAHRPGQLVLANAQCSGVEQVTSFAGPVLAGAGVAVVGPGAVAAGLAVAAALASVLCLRLGLPAPARSVAAGPHGTADDVADDSRGGGAGGGAGSGADGGADGGADVAADGAAGDADGSGAKPSAFREATEGLRVLRRDAAAAALLLVLAADFVIAGALDILGTAFAVDSLGLDASAAGLVVGASGLGGLAGALLAAAATRRRTLAPVVVGGCVLEGLAVTAVAGTGALATATAAMVVSGVGAALMTVAGRTLLQRATDDAVLARVFAVQESVSLVGYALGAAVAPALVAALGTSGAFVPLGLGAAASGACCWVLVRRLDARAVVLPEETGLLRSVPFLTLLPPYELERLARAARTVTADAGVPVVRQGDPGEEYFVVADGELTVLVDGAPRPAALRRGDGFGEIALLHSVPRTATVVPVVASRLLALRTEDFLAAVTGSADGRRVADEVAAAHLARDADRVTG